MTEGSVMDLGQIPAPTWALSKLLWKRHLRHLQGFVGTSWCNAQNGLFGIRFYWNFLEVFFARNRGKRGRFSIFSPFWMNIFKKIERGHLFSWFIWRDWVFLISLQRFHEVISNNFLGDKILKRKNSWNKALKNDENWDLHCSKFEKWCLTLHCAAHSGNSTARISLFQILQFCLPTVVTSLIVLVLQTVRRRQHCIVWLPV
jgi:hypothetical protein